MFGQLSILVILLLSLVSSVIIYMIGGRIGVNAPQTENTLAPYACGEELPAEKSPQSSEEFFSYIAYFLIFDIAGFLLALSIGNPSIYGMAFILIILISSVALFRIKGGR